MPDTGAQSLTGISAVFPAYNEERSVRSTLARALDAMRSIGLPFEILVVDDASSDSTGRIAEDLARENPEVRVLRNPANLGQGAGIVLGFQQARYDLVIHNAMDYPFDLRDLGRMLPLLERADIVVASRDRRAGYTMRRKIMSVVNGTLLRLLFGLKLRDSNFVQLYRRAVWRSIRVESHSTAFLTPEALIRARDMGFRIVEMPARYHPRQTGKATAGSFRVVSRSVRDMLRFWWKRSIARREYRAQLRNGRGEVRG
jgi:glycosyltransferase involved in cell wall biosynthesis